MPSLKTLSTDFAFFSHLWHFYVTNRGRVRQHYRELTRRYLDYNDPSNAHAFLRQPQFEALEMYILLKEYLDNRSVAAIFKEWQYHTGPFVGRTRHVPAGQLDLFEELTKEQYEDLFAQMRRYGRAYPNYIFALTMGTGKTILMAACIFYEFLLANKFPKDPHYCHNALVFAPDTTVLESLREIQTFDKSLVVPPEYVRWVDANIRFHFLDQAGTTLDTLDGSRFNLIISNTQKIILKRQHQEKSPLELLLSSGKPTYQSGSVYDQAADLYAFDEPSDEVELTTNQRFEKLRRLQQLGVYIDEAHHAFGRNLARDVGAEKDTRPTSLRLTIDELAASLDRAGTHVVACYNYTGTPYVSNRVLPEVVYAFGLQDAIDKQYLKQIRINGYTNPRTAEFVRLAIDDFLAHNDLDDRYETLRPKLAFFAATIQELQEELRPAVELALARHGIPSSKILVNVGDPKLTTDDDIREFNRLDTPGSEKQFILLVNKGREGWNCRSLFGVALFRKPNSKIFVLQATMRCLRSIGDAQPTGRVYLSAENMSILQDELSQNFRVDMDSIQTTGSGRVRYRVAVVPPPVKIRLKRVRRLFDLQEKPLQKGASLDLDQALTTDYRLIHTVQEDIAGYRTTTQDISDQRERRRYSPITLVAEIARYLNKPCLEIEQILAATAEGPDRILERVNLFNELLHDWIIPRLFNLIYEVHTYTREEPYEVALVKDPPEGHYEISGKPNLTVTRDASPPALAPKSFHLDTYCFDSQPEQHLFWSLLRDSQVTHLYFTGMLTHGQSEFYVQYIDPDSHALRSYYPDFLVQTQDGSFIIIEVKGDHQIDNPTVQAKKDFANQLAAASRMRYEIIKSTDASAGRYSLTP